MVLSHLLCAYLNQLWQKDLQVSVWYLLKEVNRCPPHSRIRKAEKDEGPVDLAMSGANVCKTNTQNPGRKGHFLHVHIQHNLLVTEKKERLLRQIDGPVLHNGVYFCQVLGLPPGGSTQQQMQKSAAFVTAMTFSPEESFLIFCQATEGDNVQNMLGKVIKM